MKAFISLMLLCAIFKIEAQSTDAPALDTLFSSGMTKEAVISFGNLCDIDGKTKYAEFIKAYLFEYPDIKAIVLNGDFVNNEKNFGRELQALDSFLTVLAVMPIEIILIPGDRDWDNSSVKGWSQVKLIEDYVKSKDYPNVLWPLTNGCPGPELITITNDLKLIAIQTQWWNHPYLVPTPASAACDIASEDDFYEEVEEMMEDLSTGNLIVAGHMPLVSNGRYGGRFPFKDWLFPVPIISSFKAAFKQNIGSSLDVINEQFLPFREEMLDIFADHFSMVYLSGHDLETEALLEGKNIYINSGAPYKKGYVAKARNRLFQRAEPGFVKIRFHGDGAAYADFVQYTQGSLYDELNTKILQAPCMVPMPMIPVNERLVPCAKPPNVLDQMIETYPDSARVVGNSEYRASGFQAFFLGKHYRDSWTQPIKSPVLNLDQAKGGLKPYVVGGGKQTRSLRFRSTAGLDYVFRSVDKDPDRGLSVKLRSTFLSLLLKDQTTTQQPYGAMVVGSLLDHTDILHAKPNLYLLPDDPKLGPFQNEFGGMLGILEERASSSFQGKQSHFGADKIRGSIGMFRKMYQDHHHQIDTEKYLKARMFDIFIGDWQKEEDNWKWAGYKTDTGTIYSPIPKDRDDAFSLWDGFIPWLADRKWAAQAGESFGSKINDIRSLTWTSRHMDRYLTNELTLDEWLKAARYLQEKMTPEVIHEAVQKMPVEIAQNQGKNIESKLLARVAKLEEYAEKFYRLLTKQVDVVGTIHREKFDITINPDGGVSISMSSRYKEEEPHVVYHRIFSPEETDEIRLFGLQDNDCFDFKNDLSSKILIRIVPGTGLDTILDNTLKGKRKNLKVYDNPGDITSSSSSVNPELSKCINQKAYYYDRTAFKYNTYFPLAFLYYTGDNGVSLKAGIKFTNQSFEKPDFSSIHNFQGLISSIGNVQLRYEGKWRHVFRKWDFVAGLKWEKKQRFRYFFGSGNNNAYDPVLRRKGYYTLQYRSLLANVGVLNEYWKNSSTYFGFSIEQNSDQLNPQTVLVEEGGDVLGRDPLGIVKAHVHVDLDFRDGKYLPRRGMRFFTEHFVGKFLNGPTTSYMRNTVKGEYFGTAHPFTFGIRTGGIWHHGNFPYYDRNYFGQNHHLRGFRRNRFTGKNMFYLNSEIRWELINKPTSVVPYQLGLKLFYDYSMIRTSAEANPETVLLKERGYGAGVYFVPLREAFVFNVMFGFSREESGLIIITVGKDF